MTFCFYLNPDREIEEKISKLKSDKNLYLDYQDATGKVDECAIGTRVSSRDWITT